MARLLLCANCCSLLSYDLVEIHWYLKQVTSCMSRVQCKGEHATGQMEQVMADKLHIFETIFKQMSFSENVVHVLPGQKAVDAVLPIKYVRLYSDFRIASTKTALSISMVPWFHGHVAPATRYACSDNKRPAYHFVNSHLIKASQSASRAVKINKSYTISLCCRSACVSSI